MVGVLLFLVSARRPRQFRGEVSRHAPDHSTTPAVDPGCRNSQIRGRHTPGHGCEGSRADDGTGEGEGLEHEHVDAVLEATGCVSGVGAAEVALWR